MAEKSSAELQRALDANPDAAIADAERLEALGEPLQEISTELRRLASDLGLEGMSGDAAQASIADTARSMLAKVDALAAIAVVVKEAASTVETAQSEYRVVKNRLARLAVKELALDPLATHFRGPTGLVFTAQDPVPMAKALQTFVRTNPALTIKVGFVEGRVVEPAELKALADLPSKEGLRAQLVGALQGPLSQLVSLLAAPQRELVRILEARSKQTEATKS